MTIEAMSTYEQKAFAKLSEPIKASNQLVKVTQESTDKALEWAQKHAMKLPKSDEIAEAFAKAGGSMVGLASKWGIQSVSIKRVIKRLEKAELVNGQTPDFKELDLSQLDRLLNKRKVTHHFVAVAEGAGTSIAITGGEALSFVGGAGVALGAIAVDSVAVITGLGRIVGEVAVNYGYDPKSPEEEMFALQVLSFGLAGEQGAKAVAFASLSRLAQDISRRAPWTKLNQHIVANVAQKAFKTMGFRLTQKKLGQIVPVVGIILGAGMNMVLVDNVHKAAMKAYRLRFLTEKYGLEPPSTKELVLSRGPNDETALQIDTLLAEAVENPDAYSKSDTPE